MTEKKLFPKRERMVSNKAIQRLFTGSESFVAYPLRIVYRICDLENSENANVTVLTSVSKRSFKRAVKRNRMKRLIKETYRLNKADLIKLAEERGKQIELAFIYLKNELLDYKEIEQAMNKALDKLSAKLEESE